MGKESPPLLDYAPPPRRLGIALLLATVAAGGTYVVLIFVWGWLVSLTLAALRGWPEGLAILSIPVVPAFPTAILFRHIFRKLSE